MKKSKRSLIQSFSTFLFNINLGAYRTGTIYKGKTKIACVPILNCYSCPGAIGSCPIGSYQAVAGGRKHNFSFYVLGFLLLFASLLGRLVCGLLCPFGFFQDLLYKIPVRKIKVRENLDKILRKLKYLILLLFVVIFPVILTNKFGQGDPYFCKYICPAGSLGAGLPLVLKNPSLRSTLGFLFTWKIFLLSLTTISSIFIYRPFCKYICPLGAFYAFFNKFSFYKLSLDKDKCVDCGLCEKACKMGVDIRKDINSPECIRCGECKSVCKFNAIN